MNIPGIRHSAISFNYVRSIAYIHNNSYYTVNINDLIYRFLAQAVTEIFDDLEMQPQLAKTELSSYKYTGGYRMPSSALKYTYNKFNALRGKTQLRIRRRVSTLSTLFLRNIPRIILTLYYSNKSLNLYNLMYITSYIRY